MSSSAEKKMDGPMFIICLGILALMSVPVVLWLGEDGLAQVAKSVGTGLADLAGRLTEVVSSWAR